MDTDENTLWGKGRTVKLIDADEYVTVWLYDDEYEEHYTERMTIADSLDYFTDEGCPNEVKSKQGKWIYQFRDSENEEYRCSECNYPTTVKHNFCPNCGTIMKGVDDE